MCLYMCVTHYSLISFVLDQWILSGLLSGSMSFVYGLKPSLYDALYSMDMMLWKLLKDDIVIMITVAVMIIVI